MMHKLEEQFRTIISSLKILTVKNIDKNITCSGSQSRKKITNKVKKIWG